MKSTIALFLTGALALASGLAPAQSSATPTPAALPRQAASAPARVNQPADLSGLAPRDASQKQPVDTRNSIDRYDTRGVNCSNYPARCR